MSAMDRRRDDDEEGVEDEESAKKRARLEEDRERLLSALKIGMFALVKDGNLEDLQALLNKMSAENGERAQLINSVDDSGETILHVAVIFKKVQMIRWILSDEGGRAAGFNNILAATAYPGTALHHAAKAGDLAVFLAIVEGCKVENGERQQLLNVLSAERQTVLHVAAYEGKIPVVQWIISDTGGRAAGFNSIIAESRLFGTALYTAMCTRHSEAFFAILEASKVENGERAYIVNSVTDSLNTILHAAVGARDVAAIQWILSDDGGRAAGFNKVTQTNLYGRTALHNADSDEREEIFHAFVAGCKPEELTEIINAVDSNGWNMLHHAAFWKEPAIIQWLLSEEGRAAGFNRDLFFALTPGGMSVLHFAAQEENLDSLRIILSSCPTAADRKKLLSGIDNAGWNIFHHATLWGKPDNISYFVDNYPEESKLLINRRDDDGMTPLHHASTGRFEFDIQEEEIVDTVHALLGYEREDEEGAEAEEAVDGALQTTRTRRVTAAVGVDPNVGLRLAEFN